MSWRSANGRRFRLKRESKFVIVSCKSLTRNANFKATQGRLKVKKTCPASKLISLNTNTHTHTPVRVVCNRLLYLPDNENRISCLCYS